jgi:hypothetical protein
MRSPGGSDRNAYDGLSEQGKSLHSCLESVRDHLARSLVQDHYAVTDPDLNSTIVSSILQVIFLKTGQEYGFVEAGTLAALAECDGIGKCMARACSDAGLIPQLFFERGPEGSRLLPLIPDKPLRELIQRMDHPAFPAPLLTLSLDDLVSVLEHFLGTRVQGQEGCRVSRAAKSALLYTGTVDVPSRANVTTMVSQAMREISEGSTTAVDKEYRIIDPACGSGLFLLEAYRRLVHKKTRLPGQGAEMQESLQDHAARSVFGIDIDPESVSAARFVLLLAFIEESRCSGCGVVSPGQIQRVCICLKKTIRCGNAIIAPEYFSEKTVFPFNAEERRRVNAFDWIEAFPEIMDEGGFNAVICAPPPYRPHTIREREDYFQTHYIAYASSAGLYGYFIERSLASLKPGGIVTALVPGTFLHSRHSRPLRRLLLTNQIIAITSTGRSRQFPDGAVPVYILSIGKQPPSRPVIISPDCSGARNFTLDQHLLDAGSWKLDDTRSTDILKKIQKKGPTLDDYTMGEIYAGIHHERNNPFVVDQAMKNHLTKNAWWCRHFFVPLLRPVNIRRYVPEKPELYLLKMHPGRHLRKCRELVTYLEKKCNSQDSDYERNDGDENTDPFSRFFIRDPALEENRPKIIFPSYQHNPAFCCDQDGHYAITQTLFAIFRDDLFLAGILNSSLGRFVLTRICTLTDRGYHISHAAIGKFPVYVPDFDKLADKTRHDKMVSLVSHILELNRYLARAKTDQERRLVRQEIDTTDVRIDALVYELYGLTADEIAVIEEAVGGIPSPS